MTTDAGIARRKLSLLELAQDLGNVSKACKLVGYSRQRRHDLLMKHERLLRLERSTAERTLELTAEQAKLLERFSPEFRERHIEAPHTGALVAVDTFGACPRTACGRSGGRTSEGCRTRVPADRDRLPLALQPAEVS